MLKNVLSVCTGKPTPLSDCSTYIPKCGFSKSQRKRVLRQRSHKAQLKRYKVIRQAALQGVRFREASEAQYVFRNEEIKSRTPQAENAAGLRRQNLFRPTSETIEAAHLLGKTLSASRPLLPEVTLHGDTYVALPPNGTNVVPLTEDTMGERAEEVPKDSSHTQESSTTMKEHSSHKDDRDALFAELADLQTFRTFKIPAVLHKQLMLLHYTSPTILQSQVIPVLRAGASALIVGPTGSGKTLAYLIPLVARLYEADEERLAPFPSKPRMIVLVPTQELADQVCKTVVRLDLSRKNPKRKELTALRLGLGSLGSTGHELRRIGLDIVVGTPARLTHHFLRGDINFSKLIALVVDEADAMVAAPMDLETAGFLALVRRPSLYRGSVSKDVKKTRDLVGEVLRSAAAHLEEVDWKSCGSDVNDSKSFIKEKAMRMQEKGQFIGAMDPVTGEFYDVPPEEAYRNYLRQSAYGGTSHHDVENENADDLNSVDWSQETDKPTQSTTVQDFPQLVFVTAAQTPALSQFLETKITLKNKLQHIIAPDAHMVPAQTEQTFVAIGGSTRFGRLVEVLQETGISQNHSQSLATKYQSSHVPVAGAPSPANNQAVVFTRTIKGCRYIADQLSRIGFNVRPLHGDLPNDLRQDNFAAFLKRRANVLVATNVASRGLDLPSVNSVVMYDIPRSAAEYIHRAGRTARGSLSGDTFLGERSSEHSKWAHPIVVVYISFIWRDKNMMKEIINAAHLGRALHFKHAGIKLRSSLMAQRDWAYDIAARERRPRGKVNIKSVILGAGRHVGPIKRIQLKSEYFRLKQVLQHKALIKRGIISAKTPFVTRPDIAKERSETDSYTRIVRNTDGTLQALPTSKNAFRPELRKRRGVLPEEWKRRLPGDALSEAPRERQQRTPTESESLRKKILKRKPRTTFADIVR